MTDPNRNLTDDDVAAIIEGLKEQIVSDFYGEVGRGVWYWCKKVLLSLMLLLAIYGMAKEGAVILPPAQVRP